MARQKKIKNLLIPIIVCTITSFFYVYDYILRVMPAAMTNVLMRDFHIHAGGLGVLASLFFWGYAPMQIPCGILFDRFSTRKIMTTTVLFSALATLGFAYTDSFALASLYRFMMGFTTSFAFIGALVVGAHWFRGQYFAMYSGLVQFLGCMGAIIGITPVALLTEHLEWRYATLWIAVAGFILAFLMLLFVKDASKDHLEMQSWNWKMYREAFSHAQTWWTALFGFAIWAPITTFATTWGVNYIESTYNVIRSTAGNDISTIWWTIAFAGPTVGWLSRHLKSRRWPMWICSSIGVISALFMISSSTLSHSELIIALIGYGIGGAGLVIPFGLIVDLHPPQVVGTIVGFINMAVIFGGLTLIPAVGYTMQHLWNGAMSNGFPVYSHHNYVIALLVLPASYALAFITTFLVKETHCKKLHCY